MLHWYWFGYAGKTFRAVLDKDPGCAMAYWGMALDLLGNSLSYPPSRQNADAAWKLLEEARSVPAKTDRERAWLDAVRAYFRNHDSVPVAKRLSDYNAEMKKIAAKYPNDTEAQVFYALTLQASASKTDLTYANQLEAAAILERVFTENPKHPGATHFIIHAYDYAPLAQKGIPAARRYAGIAPAVPHARHMPAHIYSMVGLWEDSIVSNLSALEIQPDYYHAADFTVYAYLQLAQDEKAQALIREGHQHAGARRPAGGDVQLHGAGGHAGALRARARRLERRGSAAGHPECVSAGRFAHAVHARSRHGSKR